MKKHSKRLAALKVGLVLSIMITPFCFAQSVKADTSNVITYNSYGSTTRGTRGFEAFGSTYALIAYIDFNFNGQYNGIINIYLTGATPMSNFSVLCENCHIISQNTNYLQIEFYGQNNVSVNFVMKNATSGSFDIQSVTYQSMTKVGDSNTAELVNIKNRLTNIQNYTDGIESLLATNNSLLQDIKNNTANSSSGGSSSTINNIDVNVDLIADDLNLLKTSSDGILSALVDFLTDGVGGLLTIENVIDAIEDTTSALINVQNQLSTINGKLTQITNLLTSIDNNLQNIDNTIDTISWEYIYHGNGCLYSLSDQLVSPGELTYYEYDNSNLSGNSYYLYIKLPKINDIYPTSLLKINLYGRSVAVTAYNSLSYHYFYGNTQMDNLIYYYKYVPDQNEVYVDGTLYLSQNNYIVIEQKTKTGWYIANSNIDIRLLSNNDIEYWTLLSYFNQNNYNKLLLDAINNLNLSVTNTTVQDTVNNVNNYNSTMTQVHNVENNYTNQFNNLNPTIQNELNTKLQAPNGFIEGTNFIKRLFPRVVDNSSLVGFPYILILAAVVLFVILG